MGVVLFSIQIRMKRFLEISWNGGGKIKKRNMFSVTTRMTSHPTTLNLICRILLIRLE